MAPRTGEAGGPHAANAFLAPTQGPPQRSYRLEQVRAICERYQITDAQSWLLERMGDVPGAMRLLLRALYDALGKILGSVRWQGERTEPVNAHSPGPRRW